MERALVAGGMARGELHLLVPGFECSEMVLGLFEHFASFGKRGVLVIADALQTPILFGYLADQNAFRNGGGTTFGDQLIQS